MNFKKFVKERNDALLSLDKKQILDYMKKYSIKKIPSEDIVFWAGVHKARIEVTDFSEDVKNQSRKWLSDNGFKPY